jgi:hypothetical protein
LWFLFHTFGVTSLLQQCPITLRIPRKAKITVYRPRGKKHKVCSGSIVILKPTKTRRGKTIYTEVDAAPYYKLSDEGDDESPKRKHSTTPSHSRTTAPASLDNVF